MELQDLFNFKVTPEKKIKITYNGKNKINVVLSIKLIGNNNNIENIHYIFNQVGHWYVPNFNYMGCKYLSIYDIDKKETLFDWLIPCELSEGANKQNIICLGLNKSGTSSFKKDLTDLGYSFPSTYFSMGTVMADVYHNDYNSLISLLNNPRYNAYKDFPFSLPNVYKNIYDFRPNDLYVLTIRNNCDDWVKSSIKYFGWLMKHEPNNTPIIYTKISNPINERFSNFIAPMFKHWGIASYNNIEQKLKDVYNKHTDDVINFFEKKNNSNFMVVNVSTKGELKKLTDWLGIKNNKQDFSWENKSK